MLQHFKRFDLVSLKDYEVATVAECPKQDSTDGVSPPVMAEPGVVWNATEIPHISAVVRQAAMDVPNSFNSDVQKESIEQPVTAIKNVFWDSFLKRLEGRHEVTVTSDQEILGLHKDLSRGYTVMINSATGEIGVIHVTRAGINALIDQGDNTWRVVSNNNRFGGAQVVDVKAAKAFLNGR